MSVAWLRDLGLGEYEATFRENAINEKVLPNLTAEDLKDMGRAVAVDVVRGHRRFRHWRSRESTDAIIHASAYGAGCLPLRPACCQNTAGR